MDITFRGHHMTDFYNYILDRDAGYSHVAIMKKRISVIAQELPGKENWEQHSINLYGDVYDGIIQTVKLVATLDDICLGPKKETPGTWCKSYTESNCVGPDLVLLDQIFILHAGFSQNPVSSSELVAKTRNCNPYLEMNLLIYFSQTIFNGEYKSAHKQTSEMLKEKLPEKCKRLCFSFLNNNQQNSQIQ